METKVPVIRRLKVDAFAAVFPVAVAGRLQTLASAYFPEFFFRRSWLDLRNGRG